MNSHRASSASPDLAGLARLLADRTRASFCLALLDGRAWTAADLARHVGVAASTVTGHLNLLIAGGLLAEERQGRHRYVRVATDGAADLIETLASMTGQRQADASPPRPRTASPDRRPDEVERCVTALGSDKQHLGGLPPASPDKSKDGA